MLRLFYCFQSNTIEYLQTKLSSLILRTKRLTYGKKSNELILFLVKSKLFILQDIYPKNEFYHCTSHGFSLLQAITCSTRVYNDWITLYFKFGISVQDVIPKGCTSYLVLIMIHHMIDKHTNNLIEEQVLKYLKTAVVLSDSVALFNLIF